VARGVLGERAERLGEVRRVEGDARARRDVDPPVQPRAVRHAPQHRDELLRDVARIGAGVAGPGGGARAGQFAVHDPAHGAGRLLDPLGLALGAGGAQARRLAHQGLQRRLEPVGEVGGAGPGAGAFGFARGEQRVDLPGDRAQFLRPVRAHALGPARAQRGDPRPQPAERPQPDPELRPTRRRQRQREQPEIGEEIGQEGAAGGVEVRRRHGDRRAGGPAAEPRGQRDGPLEHQKRVPVRPRQVVDMHPASAQRVRRKLQRGVPERAGSLDAVRAFDLPVEPAVGPVEARIRGIARHGQPVRPPLQPREDLIELHAHLGDRAPLHMRAEELRKAEGRQAQRGEDGQSSGQREAQAQAHAVSRK
jgi:hypothetical protein